MARWPAGAHPGGVILNPSREYDLVGVHVSASSAGLRMACRSCGAVVLAVVAQTDFDGHLRDFLARHPRPCAEQARAD